MKPELAKLFDLTGRTAVVTGAATGIGEGIAGVLSAAGARVVVADIDRVGAQRVADEIGGHAHDLDVTDPDGCADILSTMEDRLDILVNNVGSYHEASRLIAAGH